MFRQIVRNVVSTNMMESDTYEIRYFVRTDAERDERGGLDMRAAVREIIQHHRAMSFTLWRNQNDYKSEVHCIKAIARALAASDEFREVVLVKKTESADVIEFR